MYPRNWDTPPALKAKVVRRSDGTSITDGVAAWHITGTTRVAAGGTLTHIANGLWSYSPTAAETDYDEFAIEFYHVDAIAGGPVMHVMTIPREVSGEMIMVLSPAYDAARTAAQQDDMTDLLNRLTANRAAKLDKIDDLEEEVNTLPRTGLF